MSNAGWGAGLQALGGGLMNLDEVLRQRRQDELKKQMEARNQANVQSEIANRAEDNRRAQEAFKAQQAQQAQQHNATMLSQYSPTDPISPEMINQTGAAGNSGMLRTTGAGMTTLPSTQWQGQQNNPAAGGVTRNSDPGAAEGVFRRQSPAERVLQQQEDYKAKQDEQARQERYAEAQRAQAATLASRASEGEANRTAKADADRRHAELMAATQANNNSFRQQGLDIQQGRLQTAQTAAADKKAASDLDAANKKKIAAGGAEDIKKLADELVAHPGFNSIFGFFDSRTPNITDKSRDAQARLDQLKASLSIEKIAEMKAQSRTGATGFGQLSERELDVLQNAAGRLQQAQTEEAAKVAIREIQATMDKVIQRNGGGQSATPTGLPKVGETFQGGKVLSIKRIN